MQPGSLIKYRRGIFMHWAVYIGNNKMIEVSKKYKQVQEVPFSQSLPGVTMVVNNHLDEQIRPFSPDEIVRRARSKIGRWDYDLVMNNCEHFAK